MRRHTIRDVAERAGVSVGTVSNALNRPEIVADDTLKRIRRAIADVGFVRDSAARQLRGGRSAAVGLVVLDIDNPFFTELARGVEETANRFDHLLILCGHRGSRAREERQLRLLEMQRVAGVLIAPTQRGRPRLHDELRRHGMSVVLLDEGKRRSDQCGISVDDVEGGRLAGQHLIELGHSNIGLINGPHTLPQCVDRRAGFLGALAEAGIRIPAGNEMEMETMTIASGVRAAGKLLQTRRRPTAFFCTNDLMALGAENAVIASGRHVPGDVAIVGYDDVPFAAMAFVPLTSIRQPAFDLGQKAAELLLEEASGRPHEHQHVVFIPEIVVRDSTVGNGK